MQNAVPKRLSHLFVSRDALNIEGLSEATLEKFIAKGFLQDFTDIFHLNRYENEIKEMESKKLQIDIKVCDNEEKRYNSIFFN